VTRIGWLSVGFQRWGRGFTTARDGLDESMLDRQITAASCHLSRATGHFYKDLFRFMLAQREVVAADFDFHRVAERRKADELNGAADQQPISMRRGRLSGGSLISATVAVVPTATELSGWGASDINSSGVSGNGSTKMALASFRSGEPGIANLADDIGFAAQQFDALLLAEAKFTQPVAQFGRRHQFLDANGGPGLDPAQGTDLRTGALALDNFTRCLRFFHSPTT